MKKFRIIITVLALLCLVLALASCGDVSGEITADGTDASDVTDVADPTGNDRDGDHVHTTYSEAVITPSTCSVAGKTALRCDGCGEIKEESEMLLPLAPHNANEATCTEDSVCADCKKVLVKKYEHFIIDSVAKEATCTEEGIARSACYRCGMVNDTVIPAQHQLDTSKLISANGSVGSRCIACGEVDGYKEEAPIIYLQFEDASEVSDYPGFVFNYPKTAADSGGFAAYPGAAIWMAYDVDRVKAMDKYVVSFDFKLNATGHESKGESMFTFIGGVTYKSEKPGTKQDWGWAFKYYETAGVVATVLQGFNDSNSIKVNKGEWISFVGLVDNTTREISVYINGSFIGKRTIHDYNDAAYGGAFCMRFYDASPVNGTSDPMFDNFKIAEIK